MSVAEVDAVPQWEQSHTMFGMPVPSDHVHRAASFEGGARLWEQALLNDDAGLSVLWGHFLLVRIVTLCHTVPW